MGPAFGSKDFGHRQGRESMGPKAVNGLGREGYKPTGPGDLRSLSNPFRVRKQYFGHKQS